MQENIVYRHKITFFRDFYKQKKGRRLDKSRHDDAAL